MGQLNTTEGLYDVAWYKEVMRCEDAVWHAAGLRGKAV